MTFDVTGLLLFLLAVVPGFLAQHARSLLIPRSLRTQSILEETGNYVLNSVLVHLLLLGGFRVCLRLLGSPTPGALGLAIAQKQFGPWAWQHRYLIAFYFVASLVLGFLLGALRGIAERDRAIGTWLADIPWLSQFLVRVGVLSFLEEAPVWYEALKQKARQERTFVEVRMKDGKGFYTGELKSYGIVSDSERNKDFLLECSLQNHRRRTLRSYGRRRCPAQFCRRRIHGIHQGYKPRGVDSRVFSNHLSSGSCSSGIRDCPPFSRFVAQASIGSNPSCHLPTDGGGCIAPTFITRRGHPNPY
jgi:hypothetical protein